jgi:short-subunit dehydrogenase
MQLSGTRFWLVGASEGIGKAVATALAERGARVAVSARNDERLAELKQLDHRIVTVVADVTDYASLATAYQQVKDAFVEVDVVMFNAGIYTPQLASVASLDVALATMNTNINGMLRLWDVVRSDMLARAAGRLIIVSSVAAYRGLPKSYAYGASKAALTNLSETLAIELAPSNITVQLVSPGFVDTRLTQKNTFAMPMIITPEKAASYIVRGIESDAAEIHFPKRFSVLMKILRILPTRLFFFIARRSLL